MDEGAHNRNIADEWVDERKYSWRKGQVGQRGERYSVCVCVCVAELTVSIRDRMLSHNLCRTELALILSHSLSLPASSFQPYNTSPSTSLCLCLQCEKCSEVLLMNSYSIF